MQLAPEIGRAHASHERVRPAGPATSSAPATATVQMLNAALDDTVIDHAGDCRCCGFPVITHNNIVTTPSPKAMVTNVPKNSG